MKVIKTRDQNIIPYIKPLVDKFINVEKIVDYDSVRYIQQYRRVIKNQMCHTWIALDEKEDVIGFCVCFIQFSLSGDFFMINCLIGINDEVEKNLIETLEKFASDNAMKNVVFCTKNTKRFENYGYIIDSHFMLREV